EFLGVETYQSLDTRTLGKWIFVAPRDVARCLFSDHRRPVMSGSLVRASRSCRALDQKVHLYVRFRQVVPDRHSGFEQEQRGIATREHAAVEHGLDGSAALDHVYPVIGIARVADYLLILLQPAVDLVPIERRMTFEGGSVVDRVLIRPYCVFLAAISDL